MTGWHSSWRRLQPIGPRALMASLGPSAWSADDSTTAVGAVREGWPAALLGILSKRVEGGGSDLAKDFLGNRAIEALLAYIGTVGQRRCVRKVGRTHGRWSNGPRLLHRLAGDILHWGIQPWVVPMAVGVMWGGRTPTKQVANRAALAHRQTEDGLEVAGSAASGVCRPSQDPLGINPRGMNPLGQPPRAHGVNGDPSGSTH